MSSLDESKSIKQPSKRTRGPPSGPPGSHTGGITVDIAEWKEAWAVGSTGFHEGRPNAFLMKYINVLTLGRPSVSVFVPLCGKAVDMRWLYDQVC